MHSGLYYSNENPFSFMIVDFLRLTDIILWYLNFAMSEQSLELRLCFSFEGLRKGKGWKLSGVWIKISWKLVSGMEHFISKIPVKILLIICMMVIAFPVKRNWFYAVPVWYVDFLRWFNTYVISHASES